jgi:hypothetical protein
MASAGVIYGFQFDQSNYVVNAGGTVNVAVYLRESFGAGDSTLLNAEGLFGGGVRVYFNEPPVPSDRAEVLALGDILPNLAFDNTATVYDLVPATSAGFFSNVGVSPLPASAVSAPSYHQVLLGTFTFTAGLNPGEITRLRATDFDATLEDNITNATFTVLDSLIADGTATITVSGVHAVPEPATLIVWSLLSCMGLAARRRNSAGVRPCFLFW